MIGVIRGVIIAFLVGFAGLNAAAGEEDLLTGQTVRRGSIFAKPEKSRPAPKKIAKAPPSARPQAEQPAAVLPVKPAESNYPWDDTGAAYQSDIPMAPAPGYSMPMAIKWPKPDFGQTIELSGQDFSGYSSIGFPMSEWLRISGGWLVESRGRHKHQQFFHGPTGLLHLALPNPSVLTPLAELGLAVAFYRSTFSGDLPLESADAGSQRHGQALAVYASWGVNVLLTKNFSLVLKRSQMSFDEAIPSRDDYFSDTKVVAQNQIMFQFLY